MDGLAGARETIQVLTGHEDVADGTARDYLDTMRRLRSMSDQEQRRLIPVPLGDWLDENVTDRVARNAILQVGEVMFPSPSENTSTGRLVAFLKEARAYGSRGIYPDDPEAAGMQGLVAPWGRVIHRHGGDPCLASKPPQTLVQNPPSTAAVPLPP